MKTLSALGVLAGGFLLSPPPKSVVVTLLWLGARAHPAVTVVVVVAVLIAWRTDRD
jgi:cytochrome c-type biogenesis protein CcmH/NrfF